jgi:hypothetical protein
MKASLDALDPTERLGAMHSVSSLLKPSANHHVTTSADIEEMFAKGSAVHPQLVLNNAASKRGCGWRRSTEDVHGQYPAALDQVAMGLSRRSVAPNHSRFMSLV